uniref:Uncharacterized protein n=1 Tax=Varanus komodoensis TaxID=61221 RepID=A0A8D2LEP4_VARKO
MASKEAITVIFADNEPKLWTYAAYLPLLPVTESPECNTLMLPEKSPSHTSSSKDVSSSAGQQRLQVNVGPDGEETRAPTVQQPPELLPGPDISSLLQDLQPSESSSFNTNRPRFSLRAPAICPG